MRIIQFK